MLRTAQAMKKKRVIRTNKKGRYKKNNCVRVVKEIYLFLQGRKDSRSQMHRS